MIMAVATWMLAIFVTEYWEVPIQRFILSIKKKGNKERNL